MAYPDPGQGVEGTDGRDTFRPAGEVSSVESRDKACFFLGGGG